MLREESSGRKKGSKYKIDGHSWYVFWVRGPSLVTLFSTLLAQLRSIVYKEWMCILSTRYLLSIWSRSLLNGYAPEKGNGTVVYLRVARITSIGSSRYRHSKQGVSCQASGPSLQRNKGRAPSVQSRLCVCLCREAVASEKTKPPCSSSRSERANTRLSD
uniref:Uncharacterized protein n=1 Tax=Peronospora matthiolae TaxID=2874970 RepID=A0AAV1T5L8_9STRA